MIMEHYTAYEEDHDSGYVVKASDKANGDVFAATTTTSAAVAAAAKTTDGDDDRCVRLQR